MPFENQIENETVKKMAKTISSLVDVHDYICIDGDKILPHVTFK